MTTTKSDLRKKLHGRKISAFMTAPRYESTWARNMIETALKEAGIPLVISQGVFYGQCMQRMLTDAVEVGVDIAITIDFDSIFTADDLRYLVGLMESGKYDAVAALQSRRSMPFPLFTCGDATKVEFDGEPLEVKTAHFGLTGIRLDKLKEVPKPWFLSTPNCFGDWEDGRVDDDIHFWRQWDAAGNKVYVDANLSIGHMEEMIARFTKDGKHEFIYPNDWFEKNIMQTVLEKEVQEEEG